MRTKTISSFLLFGRRPIWCVAWLATLACCALVRADEPAVEPANEFVRWESTIRQFENRDRESPPPKGSVLFAGSSSARLWDVEQSFPDLEAINRGFGGSVIADSTHFAERFILPLEPRIVVLYAGDNDLSRGKSPEAVAADFRAFVEKVRKGLPEVKIVFIGIKPSIRRWNLWEKMRQANGLTRAECEKDEALVFVDVAPAMLGDDGRPRKELFVADGLHLSEEGYAVWTKLVAPHLTVSGATK
ncbi:MAG: SGNH/GDSL hydrolase family protein [Planctomycetaceae bacterium]